MICFCCCSLSNSHRVVFQYGSFLFPRYMGVKIGPIPKHFIFYYTPTRREGAILQSPCPSICLSVCLSVHPSVSPSVRLSVHSHFHNRYLSFYWKNWLHIYFLFTVRLTNERVGVFLARCSVQHLVLSLILMGFFL